jgi:hypothetical protein
MIASEMTSPPAGKLWDAYTPEMYRDALIEIMTHWATVAPTIRWWFYMNFMQYYTNPVRLGEYLNEAVLASSNCVITGPDCEPDNTALEERTYWIYRDNNDIRPVATFASTQVYNAGATGAEIYALAVDLGANYMCWVCQSVTNPDWTTIARPQIVGHTTFPGMSETW